MLGPKLVRHGRLLSYNGVGYFRIPGQVAALRPAVMPVRLASTTPGLWLPKMTQVSGEILEAVFTQMSICCMERSDFYIRCA